AVSTLQAAWNSSKYRIRVSIGARPGGVGLSGNELTRLLGLGAGTCPATKTFPELGWVRPARMRISVVLPHPFAPNKPTMLLFPMSTETSSSAVTRPYCFEIGRAHV